jgi:hypothetical protein
VNAFTARHFTDLGASPREAAAAAVAAARHEERRAREHLDALRGVDDRRRVRDHLGDPVAAACAVAAAETVLRAALAYEREVAARAGVKVVAAPVDDDEEATNG